MGDREQARIKRDKLEKLAHAQKDDQNSDVEAKSAKVNKRDEKAMDKRDHAIERAQKATVDYYKDEMKVNKAQTEMKKNI